LYQPQAMFRFIKNELKAKKTNLTKFTSYFRRNHDVLLSLAAKDPKAMCRLAIEHASQLEKHQRSLPYLIQSKQKFFFKKAPDEMIELLIVVAAANPPGLVVSRAALSYSHFVN
jgi:hypothetical protein